MTASELVTVLPDAEAAVGIWFDLERALEGKNGYGGDVAEIYAYRLLPEKHLNPFILGESATNEIAAIAARNLTWIVRHFIELHRDIEIGIESGPREFRPIDLTAEAFPPFSHRIHIRVSQERRVRRAFVEKLLTLRNAMRDAREVMPRYEFERWIIATVDLLRELGARDSEIA